MGNIRRAAVAGQFYQKDADALRSSVEGYLADVTVDPALHPKALVAPHAGFVYSGAIAAKAYATLAGQRKTIHRVVLLGPCHRVAVQGLALSSADAFETPLGAVEVDRQACAEIASLPQVQVFDATHEREHSLEVHLPFLQVALEQFKVVPLVVGDATPEQVAEIIDKLWGGPETLIIVSSDLSHYLDYNSARHLDQETCHAIETLDSSLIGRKGACGRFPLSGLLDVAKRRHMTVTTLDVRNSGDTAGSKDRVVGYGAWVFSEPKQQPAPARPKRTSSIKLKPVATPAAARAATPAKPAVAQTALRKRPVASIKLERRPKPQDTSALDEAAFETATRQLLADHGANLLLLSALSIDYGLTNAKAFPVQLDQYPAALQAEGASFVTLKKNGALRGCIGSPQAYRPLVVDVAENAYRAAFADPRFPKLDARERDQIAISVSVLSPQAPLHFRDEQDLLAQLRPETDGLVIEDDGRRALFLPSVWSQLPRPEEFLQHLKVKAGLSAAHWSDGFRAWRFIAAETSAPEGS